MNKKASEKRLHLLYKRAGIMELWWDKSLEDFKGDKKVLVHVMEYIENLETNLASGRGLFFIGANGVGKTYLTTSIMKEAIEQGYTVQFSSLGGLVELFTAGWHSQDEKKRFQRKIRNVNLLAVDDVGKEHRGGSGLSEIIFDNLIRYRVQRKKTTLLTSNQNPKDVKTIYGNSIASLLNECVRIIKVGGDDYRSKLWNIGK